MRQNVTGYVCLVAALLQNPDKKKVVLKIIIQALYGLGLEKSAAEL